jgi:hypothetical protein
MTERVPDFVADAVQRKSVSLRRRRAKPRIFLTKKKKK